MSDKSKTNDLTDTDLDGVQGGGLLLPAVQAARDRKAVLQFDEADAVKRAPRDKRIVAQAGDGQI
ncbi:hypothetical protein A8B78_18410 [Jannaschia sp. EhC01]|nr:hypothetical protein A8B78_18410 [Jannaschia sp. EhC01]